MTLTKQNERGELSVLSIQLTPQQAERLQAVAIAEGSSEQEVAEQLLAMALDEVSGTDAITPTVEVEEK